MKNTTETLSDGTRFLVRLCRSEGDQCDKDCVKSGINAALKRLSRRTMQLRFAGGVNTLPDSQVDYLASQPWAFPSSLMIGCVGKALTGEITLDPVELEDAIWVPRADMQQIANGAHTTIKPARKGAIAHFLLEHWLSDTLD